MPLFVVATPIGNLQDLAPRALEVLKGVDVIACEDTRVTSRLTRVFGIETPLVSFHSHSPDSVLRDLSARLRDGARVALVSDAGTPGISDPGRELVAAAREMGVEVSPLPGPSALTALVSASGLPAAPLLFLGFLPRSGKRRDQQLRWIEQLPVSTILYESPHRICATLRELAARFGPRPAVLAREMTKRFESFEIGSLSELAERFDEPPRGEVALMIGPASGENAEEDEPGDLETLWVREAGRSLALGRTPSQVAKEMAVRSGRSRKEAYAWVLAAQRQERDEDGNDEAEDGRDDGGRLG
ncbi:MAG: 16S rRNA (cytidine(1402)-2'-O)-methyltransferase [Myxococcota bacterium]